MKFKFSSYILGLCSIVGIACLSILADKLINLSKLMIYNTASVLWFNEIEIPNELYND